MTTNIQPQDTSTNAPESTRASFRTSVLDNETSRILTSYKPEEIEVETKNLNLYYGKKQALFDVNIVVPRKRVTAFIGPSGCGKSTLLRTFNRMNDLIEGCHIDGQIILNNENIFDKSVDITSLRRRVGMVFQKANPFPKSIYENVCYGLRLQGINKKSILDEVVENSLKGAALWDEVKDRLHDSALGLSGGQQQRLVIARSIAIEFSLSNARHGHDWIWTIFHALGRVQAYPFKPGGSHKGDYRWPWHEAGSRSDWSRPWRRSVSDSRGKVS